MARQTFESAAVDGDADKPIDPAFLNVQKKLRRLMFIGGGTLGLGILAVLFAIIYRIATPETTPPPAPTSASGTTNVTVPSAASLGLPPDAKLVSTALDGNRLAVTYDIGTGAETVVVDTGSGAIITILKFPR